MDWNGVRVKQTKLTPWKPWEIYSEMDGETGGRQVKERLKGYEKEAFHLEIISITYTLCPGWDRNVGVPSIQSKKLPLQWQRAMNHGIDDAPLQEDK